MGACWDNKICQPDEFGCCVVCCECKECIKNLQQAEQQEVFYLDCYKCGKEFDMEEEHGSTNIIKGNKNNIKPIHFCGNCWDDEVDKSVENEELGCMIYNQ